jgi:hypothetical protein
MIKMKNIIKTTLAILLISLPIILQAQKAVIMVDNTSNLSQLKYSEGETVYNKQNNTFYQFNRDKPQFAEVDDEFLIETGDGYLVAELYDRVFKTKDELRDKIHFLTDLKDGESVFINGVEYELRWTPKYYGGTWDEHKLDIIPDGYFLDTIAYNQTKFNNVVTSNPKSAFDTEIGTANYSFLPNDYTSILQGFEDPTGNFEAVGLVPNRESPQFRFAYDTTGLTDQDSVLLSFWGKADLSGGSANGTVVLGGLALEGAANVLNIGFPNDGQWHRAEAIIGNGFNASERYGWAFSRLYGTSGEVETGDTIYIWNVQLEPIPDNRKATSPIKSMFKQTNNDYLYLYLKPKGRQLDLTELLTKDVGTEVRQDVGQIINTAIDYCQQGQICREIILPPITMYSNTPIIQNRGVIVSGATGGYRNYNSFAPMTYLRPTINFTFKDTTANAWSIIKTSGQTATDNTGLRNVALVLVDSAQVNNILYTNELASSIMENINIGVEAGGGTYVKNAGYHFDIPDSGSDSHYSIFRDFAIGDADDNKFLGFLYEGGVGNQFSQFNVGTDTAIVVNGGAFEGESISVEESNTGLVVNGSQTIVNISGLYTESSGSGGSTIVQTGGYLYIEDGRLQTENESDTLINFIGGKAATIVNSTQPLNGIIRLSEDYPISFINVGTIRPLYDLLIENPNLKKNVTISGNITSFAGTAEYKSNIPETRIGRSVITNSIISNGSIGDSLFLNNPVIKGRNQNLLNNSADLFPASDTTDAGIDRLLNNIPAPIEADSAETIICKADVSFKQLNAGSLTQSSLGAGEYTFSFYAKSRTGNLILLKSQLPLTEYQQDVYVVSDEWTRYTNTFTITEDNLPSFPTVSNLRVDMSAGDTLDICCRQLNEGPFPYAYTETTGAAIDNDDASINLASDLTFSGDNSVKIDALFNITPILGANAPTSPEEGDVIIVSDTATSPFTTAGIYVYLGSTWNLITATSVP